MQQQQQQHRLLMSSAFSVVTHVVGTSGAQSARAEGSHVLTVYLCYTSNRFVTGVKPT